MTTTAQTTGTLSGLEKASILLTSLGATESARVFAQLNQKERETLGAQIVRLQPVNSLARRSVMEEVSEYVRTGALQSAPAGCARPDASAHPQVERSPQAEQSRSPKNGAFKWLEEEAPEFAASVLERERPQNIALALAHLAPKPAAEILSCIREIVRNQVAQRLASMTEVSAAAVHAVDEAVHAKVREQKQHQAARELKPRSSGNTDNTHTLARILENATGRVRSSVMGAMSNVDPDSLKKLTSLMSTPEDIADLSDEDIRAVLSETRVDDVCLSLAVASDALKDRVLNNMFDEAATAVRTELESASNHTILEIGNAQDRVMEVVRRLHDAGAIGRTKAA